MGEINQTTVHTNPIIPGRHVRLNIRCKHPFFVETVVRIINCILIEPGTVPPLQTGNLAKNTLAGIEPVKQAHDLSGHVIVIPHRNDIISGHTHLPRETGVTVMVQHDTGRFPSLATSRYVKGIKRSIAGVHKAEISATSYLHITKLFSVR